MHAVVDAALPIFALIGAGYAAGRLGLFDRAATDTLNRFAVLLALPALLFGIMAKAQPAHIAQPGFAAAFGGGIAVTFALGYGHARLTGRRLAQRALAGLNASYANAGFMGIPLCLLVFGEPGLPATVLAVLFTASALFLFTVALIETDVGGGAGGWRRLGRLAASLVRNPLLVAPLVGLLLALSGLPVPGPLERCLALLGAAASPVALVCIGLFLAQERWVGEPGSVLVLVGLKLLVQPAVTGLLAFAVFDMPPVWAKVALLLAALPVGTGPFTLAKLYALEAGQTSGAILLSHAGSLATVTLLIALLG